MIDKKTDEKEAQELRMIYNHCLEKLGEIMENTQFKVEVLFGDFLEKEGISSEQITK